MVKCWGCGKEIEAEHDLKLVERIHETDLWTYHFHGWRCLADALIEKGMIEVVVRGVGVDEAGGGLL